MKTHMKVKRLSAGMVVTHQLNHECRYPLLRAYNYWDFPKGIVEPTEDPFEAARREVEEETSLRNLDFPWGPVFRETEPYGAEGGAVLSRCDARGSRDLSGQHGTRPPGAR